eukprot:11123729-Alexandrium_andersonii.AAC.1
MRTRGCAGGAVFVGTPSCWRGTPPRLLASCFRCLACVSLRLTRLSWESPFMKRGGPPSSPFPGRGAAKLWAEVLPPPWCGP